MFHLSPEGGVTAHRADIIGLSAIRYLYNSLKSDTDDCVGEKLVWKSNDRIIVFGSRSESEIFCKSSHISTGFETQFSFISCIKLMYSVLITIKALSYRP